MLYVVGTGPGDPDYMTIKALKTLERCRVVAGWPSVLKRLALGGKEVVYLSYRNQEEELQRLAKLSQAMDVCVAAHGDPSVSDWELMARIRALGVPFEVINGVSSVNVALTRAGLDLAQVVVVSQHANNPQRLESCGRHILLIPYPTQEGLRAAVEELRRINCGEIWLMENLTLPDESVRPLGEIVDPSPLTIIVAKCNPHRDPSL
jgi:cobalt-precorrin-7 (C5)-methyltransferase